MFGLMAVCGDLGCSFGPWLAGVLSEYVQTTGNTLSFWANSTLATEQIGLRTGLLAAVVFPLIMATALLIFHRKKIKP